MSAASNWLEGELIKHLFRTGSMTKPTAWHHALYTAAPGEAGGGTEVSGGSYARVNLAPLDANWADVSAGNGQTNNLVAITFAAPTANWGTVTHMAQLDAGAGGNQGVYGALTNSRIINNGDAAPSFAIGALVITVA